MSSSVNLRQTFQIQKDFKTFRKEYKEKQSSLSTKKVVVK